MFTCLYLFYVIFSELLGSMVFVPVINFGSFSIFFFFSVPSSLSSAS